MNAEQYASEAVAYLVAMAMDNKTENYHLEAACGKEMLDKMVIKNDFSIFKNILIPIFVNENINRRF